MGIGSSSGLRRCGADRVIHTEQKSARNENGIVTIPADLREVFSRGTRRRRRSEERARSPLARCASPLAARNRCIYVGDSCQRYLACAFLRLKDPKDEVNDILARCASVTNRGGADVSFAPRRGG